MTIDARFMRYVRIDAASGCWIWIGPVTDKGIPVYILSRGVGRSARRWLYEQQNGPTPRGKVCTYSCGDARCVLHSKPVTKHQLVYERRARGEETHGAVWRARTAAAKRRNAVLDIDKARNIRMRVAAGETQASVAADYLVSRACVCLIVNNRNWVELPRSPLALLASQAGLL